MIHFKPWLAQRQIKLGHALCVGLDPDPTKVPVRFRTNGSITNQIYIWMCNVVDETAQYATVFKPQIAYYEALGSEGIAMLMRLISYIRQHHPDIPIHLDCKRGDIGRTQAQYRKMAFEQLDVDAANVSPYMGEESLKTMYHSDHSHRGITTLIYTSNPGARVFQDAVVTSELDGEDMLLWMYMAQLSMHWANEVEIQNLCFVMAAAHTGSDGQVFNDHLHGMREVDEGKIPYLMPGFGTQGGFIEASIDAGWADWGSLMMNSSSGISNADDPGEAARVLADQIGDCIAGV